jgi:hypothetical protein
MSPQEKKKIMRHAELEVYQKAFAAAMKIFELSKSFPVEEKYSLIDQVRRSSRSVCANQAEAWRKRFTGHILPANSMTAKRKPLKHKRGFSSLSNVVICLVNPPLSFTENTSPSLPCSSQ